MWNNRITSFHKPEVKQGKGKLTGKTIYFSDEGVLWEQCLAKYKATHLGELVSNGMNRWETDPKFPKLFQSSIGMKHGRFRELVMLQVCSWVSHMVPLTSVPGHFSRCLFMHRCMCWLLEHFRDLPAFEGLCSITYPGSKFLSIAGQQWQ